MSFKKLFTITMIFATTAYAENNLTTSLISNTYPTLNTTQHQSLAQHIRMQKTDEIRVHAISNHWIKVSMIPKWDTNQNNFIRTPLEISKVSNPQLFRLQDTNGTLIDINQTGLKRRTMYAPLIDNDLRLLENIFIHTTQSMQVGKSYHLHIDSSLTGQSIDLSFTFQPRETLSALLHINPYGFRHIDKKIAYLGLMMGSTGEYQPIDLGFKVIRSHDGQTMFEGTGTKEQSTGWRASFKNAPYQFVYALDFSTFMEPGEYYIEHSSGISQPFTIDNDTYRHTMNTLALGMYHQRRAEALTLPYTRFTHNATIENNTYIYDSNALDHWLTSQHNWGDGIRYPSVREGQRAYISGGHMDAGDYSPYTYNSAMTVWNLITTLDLFKETVSHDNLGLPESGDGIPDLLQEMLIELHWLKDMQDYSDGGVFSMSKPEGMHYQSTMPGVNSDIKRYLAPKDTTVTAGYAAALARAARSPLLREYDRDLTLLLEYRAIQAWNWLDRNSGMHGYHHYGKAHPDGTDEGHEHARAWAAIELYALTGMQKYHDDFLNYHKPLQRDNGVYLLNEGYGYTNRTLFLWDNDDINHTVNPEIKEQSINRFIEAMDGHVSTSERTPYGLILNDVIKRWNLVGWYFPVSQYSWDLLIANKITNNTIYKDVAQQQIHFTLGANPSNLSYITGLGYKRLKSTVDQKSRYDGIKAPVSGLPVSPVVTNYSWSHHYRRHINRHTYPLDNPNANQDVYGILESAYDGWNINAEFTIEKLTSMLTTMAILTPVSDIQYNYPEFNLSITKIDNGHFRPTITFEGQTPNNYTILWHENDEAVSADPDYHLIQDFNNPVWKLSAEIITQEGRRWYDSIRINTRDYNNTNIPLENHLNTSSATLFHLDNSTIDENNISQPLSLEGNARFDTTNLNWMQNESGAALRFNGFGDHAKVILDMNDYLLNEKTLSDIQEVSIDGLFYFEKLGDINQNILNIFHFKQSWANALQLNRYGWTQNIRATLGKVQKESQTINNLLTLEQWHYISLKRDEVHDTLEIDGQVLFKIEHKLNTLLDSRNIAFEFGNFHGWSDEIRVNIDFN